MSQRTGLGLDIRQIAILAAISVLAIGIAVLPSPTADQTPMLGLAVVVATVSLFATGVVHGLVISAVFFVLALATATAPVWVLASGLWANATLLIFGGLIIGTAADRSGLGRYVARGLLRHFLKSYPHFLLGILIGTGALSFLIPSTMARLAITLPIVIGLAKEAGYAQGSSGYSAAVLTAVAGNFLTAYGILPANLVNVIAHGAAEQLYGRQVGYFEHLLLYAPVLGIAKAATFLGLVLLLFRAPPPTAVAATERPPLGRDASRLAILLGVTVLLWATDSFHGLKPGWIAFGTGILCLLPPIALLRPREALDTHRLNAVLSVPAALGLASVLTHSGAGDLISSIVLGSVQMEARSAAFGFAMISVVTAAVALLATTVGTVAIITPLLGTVEAATGLSIKAGLVAEMVGLQALFFHYEAVPIMVGIALGGVSPVTAARLMVPLALSGLVIILPLALLWLKLLGVIA